MAKKSREKPHSFIFGTDVKEKQKRIYRNYGLCETDFDNFGKIALKLNRSKQDIIENFVKELIKNNKHLLIKKS